MQIKNTQSTKMQTEGHTFNTLEWVLLEYGNGNVKRLNK